jgi:hypothetical protein
VPYFRSIARPGLARHGYVCRVAIKAAVSGVHSVRVKATTRSCATPSIAPRSCRRAVLRAKPRRWSHEAARVGDLSVLLLALLD